MDRKEIIKIFITISLIIVGNFLEAYGQKSPMDVYETDMKLEYERHNIANITKYILNHKEIGKSEFVLDGKLYKMKVKDAKTSGGYVRNPNSKDNEWVEGESLNFYVR